MTDSGIDSAEQFNTLIFDGCTIDHVRDVMCSVHKRKKIYRTIQFMNLSHTPENENTYWCIELPRGTRNVHLENIPFELTIVPNGRYTDGKYCIALVSFSASKCKYIRVTYIGEQSSLLEHICVNYSKARFLSPLCLASNLKTFIVIQSTFEMDNDYNPNMAKSIILPRSVTYIHTSMRILPAYEGEPDRDLNGKRNVHHTNRMLGYGYNSLLYTMQLSDKMGVLQKQLPGQFYNRLLNVVKTLFDTSHAPPIVVL